jgi:hypothetical protein
MLLSFDINFINREKGLGKSRRFQSISASADEIDFKRLKRLMLH